MEALDRAASDPAAEQDTAPEVAAEADLVDEISCWERAEARSEARQLKAMAAASLPPILSRFASRLQMRIE